MSGIPATASIPAELQPRDQAFAIYGLREEPVSHGAHAGTPAVVVRLQGCPVACPWCNQPAGIPEPGIADLSHQASEEDLEAGDGTAGWRWVTGTRLLALIGSYASRHVVLSGGEPAQYNLTWLTETLQLQGHTVQVETSGVVPLSVSRDTWVTLSPKHAVHPDWTTGDVAYRRADEIIVPVAGRIDERWLDRALKAKAPGVTVWLLPLAGLEHSQSLAWDLARRHQVRICT